MDINCIPLRFFLTEILNLTCVLRISFCYGPNEEEIPFSAEEAAVAVPTEDAVSASTSDEEQGKECHFHARVE